MNASIVLKRKTIYLITSTYTLANERLKCVARDYCLDTATAPGALAPANVHSSVIIATSISGRITRRLVAGAPTLANVSSSGTRATIFATNADCLHCQIDIHYSDECDYCFMKRCRPALQMCFYVSSTVTSVIIGLRRLKSDFGVTFVQVCQVRQMLYEEFQLLSSSQCAARPANVPSNSSVKTKTNLPNKKITILIINCGHIHLRTSTHAWQFRRDWPAIPGRWRTHLVLRLWL